MRIAGSWTMARPFGVPLRVHWSLPVCALIAGGLHVAPGAWLAYVLLVLVHEAGHALVVKRVGARPTALELLGFGGLCRWEGAVTPLQRACIAWGGIWAQMLVFVVAGAAVLALGRPAHWFADQMVDVALTGNLWLMGVNLLPLRPLDGEEAWSLFPLLRRRLAARRAARLRVKHPPALALRAPDVASDAAPRALPPAAAPPRPAGEDDFAEEDFTPEVLDVIERTRAIARDAARDPPTRAGRLPGNDENGGGQA